MVLTLALFTSLLFSTAALARASPEGPPAWHQAQPHAPKPRAIERSKSSETTTTRWTGAYLDGAYNSITGTVTVPKVQFPVGGRGTYNGTIWLGIVGEGKKCGHAAAQVGLYFEIDKNNTAAWWGWYSWWPEYYHWFTGFSIEEGDTVTLSVIAGTHSGDVIIENHTTCQRVGKSLSSSSYPLCKTYANWLVELWPLNGIFVDFGTVTFSNTLASNLKAEQGPAKAKAILTFMPPFGQLAKISMNNTAVTITYIWWR